MATNPKAVRTTAKRHAEASRKGGALGKLGDKTTESTKAWPKMTWDQGLKAAAYVGNYASRNSEFDSGRS